MAATSPIQLRQNILAARAEIETVRQLLLASERERQLGLGSECARTATELKDLLEKQVVPSEYRVAVVGRFKAGKSSFVNELLGRKLAGEETNPETAAVTTFRYGPDVRARVYFLSREQWQSLKLLHADNPKDLEAHRIINWLRFPTRKPDGGADKPEVFDEARLAALEREYLADGGKFVDLVVSDLNDRKAVIAFRKELKKFTTGSRPQHCLVERIEITAPSPLLEQGILLIDTPGLGDTERFRVALTEQIVKDVDAVLFLTKSGPAFDQSEKDFLLSLLRRGTVKQLAFVVTQVDQTYEQHVNAAKSDDEEPEPIQMRIERERRRLRAELDSTLTALGQGSEDSPALERYREQLGEIELVFTSAINHRKANGRRGGPLPSGSCGPRRHARHAGKADADSLVRVAVGPGGPGAAIRCGERDGADAAGHRGTPRRCGKRAGQGGSRAEARPISSAIWRSGRCVFENGQRRRRATEANGRRWREAGRGAHRCHRYVGR